MNCFDDPESWQSILANKHTEGNNMKTDYFEYSIATHFIPALEYGDTSGLTSEDAEYLDIFIERIEDDKKEAYQDREYIPCRYNTFSYSEECYFLRDQISGLIADTIILTVTFEIKEG